MEDSDKKLIAYLGIAGLVIVILCVWALVRFTERNNECKEINGVLIKTVEGWKCADKGIFK